MKKVVACVDGASYTVGVCDYAAWAAQRLSLPLELLHVLIKSGDIKLDASGNIGMGAQESLLEELASLDERRSVLAREHGQHVLQGAQQRLQAAGMRDVSIRQRHGELVETLLDTEPDTRLFVMGQHNYQQKPRRLFLDYNLESAVRALHRPILVATGQFVEPKTFMIAFDASETAQKMVDRVADSPLLQGLSCVLAMVGDDIDALQAAQQRLAGQGFEVRTETLQGEPTAALMGFAEQSKMDMLVMGAYGHSRIRQLVVGSTTSSILRRAQIPVFILR